jgi:hypothetical protein
MGVIIMASFNNLEEVKKLYESVNGLESENNFFVGIKDARKNAGVAKGMEYPYTQWHELKEMLVND